MTWEQTHKIYRAWYSYMTRAFPIRGSTRAQSWSRLVMRQLMNLGSVQNTTFDTTSSVPSRPQTYLDTYYLSGRLQSGYLDCRQSTNQLGPSSHRSVYQNHRWSGICALYCLSSEPQRTYSPYPLQTLIELSPLLRNMGNRESIQMTATQALQELESIAQSIPASRMFAPLA